MNTGQWSHGGQVAAILGSLGLLFLGILAIRDKDKAEVMEVLAKIQKTEAGLTATVQGLQSLMPVAASLGQTVAEIHARQQINEHRIDVLEQQLRGKPWP